MYEVFFSLGLMFLASSRLSRRGKNERKERVSLLPLIFLSFFFLSFSSHLPLISLCQQGRSDVGFMLFASNDLVSIKIFDS